MLEHISKLEEALYNIQFEQHWLEAQTDRQAIGTNVQYRKNEFVLNLIYVCPSNEFEYVLTLTLGKFRSLLCNLQTNLDCVHQTQKLYYTELKSFIDLLTVTEISSLT